MARVLRIDSDPHRPDHAYAVIGDYLPFDAPVPFHGDGLYWEAPLRAIGDPNRVGAGLHGKAMRPLDDADFAAIVRAGLRETLAPENAVRRGLAGVQDVEQAVFQHPEEPPEEQVRRIELMLINRKIRDANFRRQVCEAYEDRCAVAGLRIINGGGRLQEGASVVSTRLGR